jgi:hypothetical protein
MFDCSIQSQDDEIQATINISKIVDKVTQQPIVGNPTSLKRETEASKDIKTETYKDQSQLSFSIPADGIVNLFVIGKAPG